MAGGAGGGEHLRARRSAFLAELTGRSQASAGGALTARHCWVVDAGDLPGRWPALLIEWRRHDAGWEGFVIAAAIVGGSQTVVQRWVDGSCLHPVTVR